MRGCTVLGSVVAFGHQMRAEQDKAFQRGWEMGMDCGKTELNRCCICAFESVFTWTFTHMYVEGSGVFTVSPVDSIQHKQRRDTAVCWNTFFTDVQLQAHNGPSWYLIPDMMVYCSRITVFLFLIIDKTFLNQGEEVTNSMLHWSHSIIENCFCTDISQIVLKATCCPDEFKIKQDNLSYREEGHLLEKMFFFHNQETSNLQLILTYNWSIKYKLIL